MGTTSVAAAVVASSCVVVPLMSAAPAGAATTATGNCAQADKSPGVTSKSITTGSMSTLTGPIASNFQALVPGIKAYYSYINALGGVNGRKLNLTYPLDDTGNPSQDVTLAHTLIDQDKVFAVAGTATAFFTPNYFVATCTPTFGYNVTGNWAGPPNMFAAGGSVQEYGTNTSSIIWAIRHVVKTPSVAVLALGIAASHDSCAAYIPALKAAGVKVSYEDTNVSYGGSLVPDAQRMKAAGSNYILSCMDIGTNLNLARALKQYNLKPKQMWLSGSDATTLQANKSLIDGVYFNISHVPFTASQSAYPGLKTYLAAMKKYQPKYVYDEVAFQGWQSASLLATGLKGAGKNPTQLSLINAVNSLSAFNAGGMTTPVNWTSSGSGHNPPITYPTCSAYIQAKGTQFYSVFTKSPKVFLCFNQNSKNPVTAPAGTPGG